MTEEPGHQDRAPSVWNLSLKPEPRRAVRLLQISIVEIYFSNTIFRTASPASVESLAKYTPPATF